MKNENEIKRAFAMEVLKFIEVLPTYPRDTFIRDIHVYIQSLLPKEEETKTESDEVKDELSLEKFIKDAEQKLRGIEFNNIEMNPRTAMLICVAHLRSMLPKQPTLEQKARKKAEEMFRNAWKKKTGNECDKLTFAHMDYCVFAIEEGILFDPKKLD